LLHVDLLNPEFKVKLEEQLRFVIKRFLDDLVRTRKYFKPKTFHLPSGNQFLLEPIFAD